MIVRLPGIAINRRVFADFMRQSVSGKAVQVSVNPSDWPDRGTRQKVTGRILVEGELGDVGLALLRSGKARFLKPRPYALSAFDTCRYRLAEQHRP